jgi:geranylgeranyl diphosphate synthase type I
MTLQNYLSDVEARVGACFEKLSLEHIKPYELNIGTIDYFLRGGKRLRPAILMLCAGIVGGKECENKVVSAALAVELFHTFTLIHDDIIDNDPTRRGGKSVHVLVSDMFESQGSSEYGRDVAILSGDMLHALSVKALLDMVDCDTISAKTVIAVTQDLENRTLAEVLEGEALDTRAGLLHSDFSVGSFEETLNIMDKKTGALFAFAARSGAMLGLDTSDMNNQSVVLLSEFARLCGIAFQIQDDVLGITADEKKLGKPIGSDIREGKKTLILQHAYNNANEEDKKTIESIVGVQSATETDIQKVKDIFIKTGAIDYAKRLANEYIGAALEKLSGFENSVWLEILKEWADFMSNRSL